ncbi:MAG: DUF2442 domain-containing protein [Clostridia bacterium]|nr:DUF2442 domain-containing protein [Clostridia bacterium]
MEEDKKIHPHTVREVYPLDGHMLRVVFNEGGMKLYDMNKLIDTWDLFRPLKDSELFYGVYPDKGGYGIIWNEDIDLSCTELWDNGVDIEPE